MKRKAKDQPAERRPTYYSLRDAAREIGVSVPTTRRLYRKSGINGIETQSIIILTEEQLQELAEFSRANHNPRRKEN